MPVTKLHRSRVRTAFLACRRVGEVTTTRIDDFTLLLLGNLNGEPAITQKKGYDENTYPWPIRTSGCMHRFFRLVKPRPMKFSSFSLCSGVSAHDIRYFISLFNSESAFSISGTVREQYISLRFVGWNCRDHEISPCDANNKFDVPAGTIRSGIRVRQFSLSQKAFLGHSAPERPIVRYDHTLQ